MSISSVGLLKMVPLAFTFDLPCRQKPRSQTITDEKRNGGISIARRIKEVGPCDVSELNMGLKLAAIYQNEAGVCAQG